MGEGLLSRATDRLKSALDGLFDEPASATMVFPQNVPTEAPIPTITVRKSRSGNPTPKPESQEPFGKITSYNWKGDPYTDSQSRAMIGSFGKLTEEGMAVSPDIERQFREQGIKPKDMVKIVLADGTTMERRWEDRTMQDKQAIRKFGKPLTGRFDLNFPQGTKPHEKDGISVVGFQKLAGAE
jgi:hypothetical protein